MTAGARLLGVATPLGVLASLGFAAAQTTTPSTFLAVPPPSHVLVELELSWNRPTTFVAENGQGERFPGSLQFGLGVLRVSYAPLAHLAVGVEAPYRTYRYSPDGFARAATGSGSPGVGVFADWAPSGERARLVFNARVGAFFAGNAHGLPLSTADGLNRYWLAGQLTTASTGGLLEGLRADFDVRFEYGPTPLAADRYAEAQIFLRAGPRIARVGPADVQLLAVGGYRAASAGREEANLFHDLNADDFVAGALLDVVWPGSSRGLLRSIALSATRQFARSNALEGWRATLTLRAGI